MKRTVSPERTPDYPAVSLDETELEEELLEAAGELEEEGYAQSTRYQARVFVPPIDSAAEILDELESYPISGVVEAAGEEGRRNETFMMEYSVEVDEESFNRAAEGIEKAVQSRGYDKNFWKVGSAVTGTSAAEVAERSDGAAITPHLIVDAGLESDVYVGWFQKAPMNPEVQFGYTAFRNRELSIDETADQEKVLKDLIGKITGERDEELNQHPLSREETETLMELEQTMAEEGLL